MVSRHQVKPQQKEKRKAKKPEAALLKIKPAPTIDEILKRDKRQRRDAERWGKSHRKWVENREKARAEQERRLADAVLSGMTLVHVSMAQFIRERLQEEGFKRKILPPLI